jgi:hypothetical protein
MTQPSDRSGQFPPEFKKIGRVKGSSSPEEPVDEGLKNILRKR